MMRGRLWAHAVGISGLLVASVVAQEPGGAPIPTLGANERRSSAIPGYVFPDKYGFQASHVTPASRGSSLLRIQPYLLQPPGYSPESGPAPGETFQNPDRGPTRARFGDAPGVPTFNQVARANAIGIARNRALNQHLEAYARPRWGFGWGYGIGGVR